MAMKLSTAANALTIAVVLVILATAIYFDYDWRLFFVCMGVFFPSYLAGWCDGFRRREDR